MIDKRRAKRADQHRAVTVFVVCVMGFGLLYEALVNQPRFDRQMHALEGAVARIGVLDGAANESESRVSNNGVAVSSRYYTTNRGLDAIDEYYGRALASEGWSPST